MVLYELNETTYPADYQPKMLARLNAPTSSRFRPQLVCLGVFSAAPLSIVAGIDHIFPELIKSSCSLAATGRKKVDPPTPAMPPPSKSPRHSLAQRLERSRRHRHWLGKDSSSVGGGSVPSATTTSSSPKPTESVSTAPTSMQKNNADGSSSQYSTAQAAMATSTSSPDKRESLIARRRRALELGRKRSGAPSPSPEFQSNNFKVTYSTSTPTAVNPQERRQTSEVKAHQAPEIRGHPSPDLKVSTVEVATHEHQIKSPMRQSDSPCESMLYQASAMESHEGNFPNDEDPVTIKPSQVSAMKRGSYGAKYTSPAKTLPNSPSYKRDESKATPSWLKRSNTSQTNEEQQPGRIVKGNRANFLPSSPKEANPLPATSSFGARTFGKPLRPAGTSTQAKPNTESNAYGATIETPEVVSVASLKASFNSRGSNQPIMPMNSTDPRVRQKMSATPPPKKSTTAETKPTWQKTGAKGQYSTPSRPEPKGNSVPWSAPPASQRASLGAPPSKFQSAKKPSVAAFWEDRQVGSKTEELPKPESRTQQTPPVIAAWQQPDHNEDPVQESVPAPEPSQIHGDTSTHSRGVVINPPGLENKSFEDAMRSKWQPGAETSYGHKKQAKQAPWEQEPPSAWRKNRDKGAQDGQEISKQEGTSPVQAVGSKDVVPSPGPAILTSGPVILPQAGGHVADPGPVILPSSKQTYAPVVLPQKEDEKKEIEPSDLHVEKNVADQGGSNTGDEDKNTPIADMSPRLETKDSLESILDNSEASSPTAEEDAQYISESNMVSADNHEVPADEDDEALLEAALSVDETDNITTEAAEDPDLLLAEMETDSHLLGDFDAAMEYASKPMPSYEDDSYVSGNTGIPLGGLPRKFQEAMAISADGQFEAEEENTSPLHLTIKQSDSTSVYIEDEREIIETPRELLHGTSFLTEEPSPTNLETVGGQEITGPNRGPSFRLTPSPKDNDAYRRGYFGEDLTKGSQGQGRRNSNTQVDAGYNSPASSSKGMSSTLQGSFPDELLDGGSNILDDLDPKLPSHIEPRQTVGTRSPVPRELAPTTIPQEDQAEAAAFADTDQWMDKDPDFDGFVDDDSLSQHGMPVGDYDHKNVETKAAPDNFPVQTDSSQVAGFDKDEKAFSWHEKEVAGKKSAGKKRSKKEVFDPFAEDDELKVENPESFFSPTQDAFMTEESFSPLDWGTPRAIRYEHGSPQGSAGGFEI